MASASPLLPMATAMLRRRPESWRASSDRLLSFAAARHRDDATVRPDEEGRWPRGCQGPLRCAAPGDCRDRLPDRCHAINTTAECGAYSQEIADRSSMVRYDSASIRVEHARLDERIGRARLETTRAAAALFETQCRARASACR